MTTEQHTSDVYLCGCGGFLRLSHRDDIGTEWYKCDACGRQESLQEIERNRQKNITEAKQKYDQATCPLTTDELTEILGSTIKCDNENKTICFLGMILTYTEEDQINIGFLAESSTGKSYIPIELAWYFPPDDVIKLGYASPQTFFYEQGLWLPEQKVRIISLHQKIVILLDMPHDVLLQRLRSLLSHDEKRITHKFVNKREKSGNRTETVIIEGYATFLFCSAKFGIADQEKTRLLLLSPEVSQEKISKSILLKIEKEADREAFNKLMIEEPKRLVLKDRVSYIKVANIKYVNIPLEKRQQIADRFLQDHKNLIPRHMRDVSRLVAIIKACALLNFEYRERFEDTIFVNDDDILEGFRLYCKISKANELGLPPEIYRIYEKLKPHLEDKETGVNRKEFQTWYYDAFHKVIGRERATEILKTLDSVGLIVELPDPIDKRFLRYVLPERGVNENNVCLGGGVNTLADTPHPDYTYFSEGKEEVKG